MDQPSMLSLEVIGSIISLSALETILNVDNVIFLSILVGKLPKTQQVLGRRLGLVLALGMRILLLLTLKWLASLTAPLFTVLDHTISGRDLVLALGGLFLIFKSTWEIFSGLEGEDAEVDETGAPSKKANASFMGTIVQIVIMDIVFSLDSVITAVGIAPRLEVILIAMFVSLAVMLAAAGFIGDFVNKHPSTKILALAFLVMIGTLLVAEGGGQHINKGYVYAAMAFAFVVELLNLHLRKRSDHPAELKGPGRPSHAPPEPDPASRIKQLEEQLATQAARIKELEGQVTAARD